MARYTIAQGSHRKELQKEVCKLVELGFVPVGGIALLDREDHGWIYQAMWNPKAVTRSDENMINLQPGWLTRLKAECAELTERIRKLQDFQLTPSYQTLSHIERNDLIHQLRIMGEYRQVLVDRIFRAEGCPELG